MNIKLRYIGNFTTIMLPFNLAHDRIKCPRIILYDKIRFNIRRDNDSIRIVYLPRNLIIGHILKTGYFEQAPLVVEAIDGLIPFLRQFASAPIATIKESESFTGKCCYCYKPKNGAHGDICKWYLEGYPKRKNTGRKTCARCGKDKSSPIGIYCRHCATRLNMKKKYNRFGAYSTFFQTSTNSSVSTMLDLERFKGYFTRKPKSVTMPVYKFMSK
jgi:hypothetical protein